MKLISYHKTITNPWAQLDINTIVNGSARIKMFYKAQLNVIIEVRDQVWRGVYIDIKL